MKVSDRVRIIASPYEGISNGTLGEVKRTFNYGTNRTVDVWLRVEGESPSDNWPFRVDELEVVND